MGSRRMFTAMDIDSRRFYARIVNTAMLNIYAVRHGLFEELICESKDSTIGIRWMQAQSLIMDAINNRNQADAGGDCPCPDY